MTDRDAQLKNSLSPHYNYNNLNFQDVEVESLWDALNGGQNNVTANNSLQNTKYDQTDSDHTAFLSSVIYKIVDSPSHTGDKDTNKDTRYLTYSQNNPLLSLIIEEAKEVAEQEYGNTTLSNMENALLQVMERYDAIDDVKGNTSSDDVYEDTSDPQEEVDLNSGNKIDKETSTRDTYTLSQEVLNDTADAYFNNIAVKNNVSRTTFTLSRIYYNPSETIEKGIEALKGDLYYTLGHLYDEDTVNIISQAARKNLENIPNPTIDDLYAEVENIMHGDSVNFTKNDSDDVRNITTDFGTIENLFNGLETSDVDLFNISSGVNVQDTTIIATNNTLERNTIKSFLLGYLNGISGDYLDELLLKADGLDGKNNGTMNLDEFTQIIRKIDDDLYLASNEEYDILLADDDKYSNIENMTEDLNYYDFIQASDTRSDKSKSIHLTKTSQEHTDYYLSFDVSSKIIDKFFQDKYSSERANKTFNVPSTLEKSDDFNTILHSSVITDQLKNDFGISSDMAELILSSAVQKVGSDATIEQIYNQIKIFITQTQSTTQTEPDIKTDFGSLDALFMMLNNEGFEFDSYSENIHTIFNLGIDKDIFVNFIKTYLRNTNIDTASLPENIDINTFYSYFNTYTTQYPAEDIGLGIQDKVKITSV